MKGKIRYKPSKYNFFFDTEDGIHLAFNAISGGFAKIRDKEREKIQKVLRNPDNCKTENENRLKQSLIRGRFLINENTSEINLLETRNRMARFNNLSFGLVIAPTLLCNFQCTYCYVEHSNDTMSPNIASQIINIVKKKVQHLQLFGISWTGGEPLIAYNLLKKMSLEFKMICAKEHCKYQALLVTNGYLLTNKVISELRNLNIVMVQVTLDGQPEIHNKRRPLKDGKGTFDVVLQNLVNLSKINIPINLRVNVDHLNSEYIFELCDILKEKGLLKRGGNVALILSRVVTFTEACKDYETSCYHPKEFGKFEIKIAQELLLRNVMISRLPKPISHICGANALGSYVIDPKGYLYKCWDDIGTDTERVGYIKDNKFDIDFERLSNWLADEPFNIKECRECRFLPMCMGGCIKQKKAKGFACPYWKNNFLDLLRINYKNLKTRRNKTKK